MKQNQIKRIKRTSDIYDLNEPEEIIHEELVTEKVAIVSNNQTNINEQNDSYELRKLETITRNALETTTYSNAIGVFGINSDTVISDVLKRLEGEYNFLGLSHSGLRVNVYERIAAAILNYINEYANISYDLDYSIRKKIYKLANDLCVRHRLEYERNDLYKGIELMERATNIDKSCREMLELARQALNDSNDKKFLFWIEVDPDDFNYNLLRDVQKIESSDLVIIVSSLASQNFLEHQLAKTAHYFEYGVEILLKFFSINNFINTD